MDGKIVLPVLMLAKHKYYCWSHKLVLFQKLIREIPKEIYKDVTDFRGEELPLTPS